MLVSYTYDGVNRLIREDNMRSNKTLILSIATSPICAASVDNALQTW